MLKVNIGDEVRQIVAGIATAYEAEKLIGRKVLSSRIWRLANCVAWNQTA